MPTKKQPIMRGDDKLVEVRAFIPKDCIVDVIVGRKQDGTRIDCAVHSVMHVFEPTS